MSYENVFLDSRWEIIKSISRSSKSPTELAKKTLMTYGCESFTVQITATYMKPIHDYDIPKEHWILWDLEDVQLCKNVSNLQNQQRLIEKHGSEFDSLLKQYSQSNIQNTYAQYPELWLLTHQIKEDIVSSLLEQTKENQNQYGWSSESCFLLKVLMILIIIFLNFLQRKYRIDIHALG